MPGFTAISAMSSGSLPKDRPAEAGRCAVIGKIGRVVRAWPPRPLMGAISPPSRGLFWSQKLEAEMTAYFPESRRKRAPHGSRSEAATHRELEKEIVQLRYAKSVVSAAIEGGEDVERSIGAPPWCVLGVRVVNANQKSRAAYG